MEGSHHNSEKEEGELSSDDDYQTKLSEMQTYIPFLQQMIQRLEQSNDKSREAQLSKMKSLYGILSNTKKKLKVETLKKCEDVLSNLRNKVEKSTSHKEGNKMKKKVHRELPHSVKNAMISDSSNSSPNDQMTSRIKRVSESDDSRVEEKSSDHEAVVSSTTQSCDSENPVTDVVKALKLAAARNNLRNKLENVKTAIHSPGHSDDSKGNVSSSSPSHLVSSSSPSKQTYHERGEHHTKEGLEQSRERLKKLMGHHLTATPSPPYHSPSETHNRSYERSNVDAASPKTEWLYTKDSSWEKYSGAQSVGSDSCDGELFTRRNGWNTEKHRNIVPSSSFNTFSDENGSKTESKVRTFEKSPKNEINLKSPKALKSHLPSSPPPPLKIFSPERGDDSDKSDGGSGSRSVRAKLEQEIHKVHRVGVSTGGALRGLVVKDDRNRPSSKGKSDGEKSPKSVKSVESFEKLNLDNDGERFNKIAEKPVDPRRQHNSDRSPPLKSNTSNIKSTDSVHAKRKPSSKAGTCDNVSRSKEGKEGAEMFSGMSHEELQRIVSENLRNLPSPPPITKEILETVKISPKGIPNPLPTWPTLNLPPKIPSTPASPDEVFHPTTYTHQDVCFGTPQSFETGRRTLLEDPKHIVESHPVVDDPRIKLAHCNTEHTMHNVYASQCEDRQSGIIIHDYDSRTSYANSQSLESMRRSSSQHHLGEDPRSATHSHLIETRDRSNENSRYKTPLLEDPRPVHNQGIDDSRMHMTHSYRDDSRRDHRNMDDSRIGGERRRGLLPTPPGYEKCNYRGPSTNSRGHVQDISTRFDQRTQLNENRLMMSPEQQNWDTTHWVNPAVYSQTQNVDRYPQQVYHSRDGRGQPMAVTPEEQFSPTGHSQGYQWNSGNNHNSQQTVHGNFMPGYQVQPRIDNVPDYPAKSRVQHADPRLHKGERCETSPDMRTGDPRLPHSDPRHSSQFSGSRQTLVAGIARQASVSERDPRRRSMEETESSRKPVEDHDDKKKRHSETWRASSMANRFEMFKKSLSEKDRKRTNSAEQNRSREDNTKNFPKKESTAISSPLDCLYGTTAIAKTGKGYGFQNFRIPKIKRELPSKPRPPTPPRPAPPKENFVVIKKENDESIEQVLVDNDVKKEKDTGVVEPKESEPQTREVTQELIEALIRKSFESGEGKKLFEHAKFFETLSESLKSKKMRKIKRILESESEDSDSDKTNKEEIKETKEKLKSDDEKFIKVKRNAVSDSDDEPLAEKLAVKTKNDSSSEKIESGGEKVEDFNIKTENKESSKELEEIVPEKTLIDSTKDIDNTENEVSKPVKKPATKRRNSLELLQQDVRDMFIREGVVTATGYRMCRLLKEVQCGASLEEISKNEAQRMENEAEGESDSSSILGKKEKKNESNSKSKKKLVSSSKVNKKLPKSNVEVLSDSDAPVPAGSKKRTKRNRQLIDDSDSDSSVSTLSRTSKSRPSGSDREIVRRRRVPRIILEKTDISKYRSNLARSRIDSEEESGDEILNDNESKKKNAAKRSYSKKKESKKSEKKLSVDDDEFFNREPYTFKRKKEKKARPFLNKKINDYIPRLHKAEIPNVSIVELFSIDKKSFNDTPLTSENAIALEKNSASVTDVASVSDIDVTANDADDEDDERKDSASLLDRLHRETKACPDDTNRNTDIEESNSTVPVAETEPEIELLTTNDPRESENFSLNTHSPKSSLKLSLVKKKSVGPRKKKSSKWQFGIIKKKPVVHKIKSEVEIVEEREVSQLTERGSIDNCSANTVMKNDNDEKNKSDGGDVQNKMDDAVQYDVNSVGEDFNCKEVENSGKLEKENTDKESTESVNFTNTDYAFHCEAKQTACLLCSYEGKSIVQHYKQIHPDSEVLISRLPIDEACRATTEAEEKGFNDSSFKGEILGNRKGQVSFLCRFCNYKTTAPVNLYEHTSSHTGEYRYQCCKCPYMSASRTTFKGHFYNHHPKVKLKQGLNLKVLTAGPSNNAKYIFGYLCSKCNFVQLQQENLLKHISLRHADDKDVKAIRINMSKSIPMEFAEASDEADSFFENSEIVTDEDTGGEMNLIKDHIDPSNSVNVEENSEVKDDKLCCVKEEPVSDKKPNPLEAFVPISLEVDNDECFILEERVKRTRDVMNDADLKQVLENLKGVSGADDDIVIILETKLQNIKQEIDTEMEIVCENVSKFSDSMNNALDVGALVKEGNIKEQIAENENVEELKNQSSTMIENSTEDSCETGTQLLSPAEYTQENVCSLSDVGLFTPEAQDLEKKTKSGLKKIPDVIAEPSKMRSLICKPTANGDEVNERRITRSLSRTDDDGRSVMSDDSGFDASNYEIIEITDESDVGEEEIDVEPVITQAKSLQSDSDEGVSLPNGTLIERLAKHIIFKDSVKSVVGANSLVQEAERKSKNDSLKPPPLAASLDKQCLEEKKSVMKQSPVVSVASLEARRCSNDSVLFLCLVPCCVFTTEDATAMEKHLARSHKPNWWDGVCSMCDKRVYGDGSLKGSPTEHKYPLSFALDHLRTVHLDNLSIRKDLEASECELLPVVEYSSSPSIDTVWTSELPIVPQDASGDKTFQGSEEATPQIDVKKTDASETKAPFPYIRTRRLSGDKLSAPPTSESKALTSLDTSCDSFVTADAENDSNMPSDAGGGSGDDAVAVADAAAAAADDDDNELPFLKIESVVSLHPSAGSNVNNTFLDPNVTDSHSSPVVETSSSSLSNTFVDISHCSTNAQQPVVAYAQKLVAVSGSPVKKQLQLIPVAPPTRGTIAVVPSSLPSTNIPQPLVNLAQLIRPGTRVVVPKESSSVAATPLQFVSSNTKKKMILCGNKTLPNILPKPTSAFIITSPAKSASSAVVLPSSIVASSSLGSGISLPPVSYSPVPLLRKTYSGAASTLTPDSSVVKFVSDGCARTSYFAYKRRKQQRPPPKSTRKILSHKLCKAFEQAKASKSTPAYQRMLIHDKLRQLFKCMAKHCTYTSESPKFFEEHCWKHVYLFEKLKPSEGESENDCFSEDSDVSTMRKMEAGAWPLCAYCCTLHTTPKDLCAHVQEEHGQCLYQCAYCFFRAVAYSYVVLHQNTNHTDMRITVLLCRKISQLLPPVNQHPARKEVVLPYVCVQGNCGMHFYNPAAFWRHLENSHANMTCYFCHMCDGQYVKPEKLLMHYKLHCFHYYQCHFCLHGSDTKEDMQHHLCNFHPNQKAIVTMRDSDPNMPAMGSQEERSLDFLKTIDLDVDHREDSLLFPPVPSIEYAETSVDFWKSYKAFADENPSINTSDSSLLFPTSSGVNTACVLPAPKNNFFVAKDGSQSSEYATLSILPEEPYNTADGVSFSTVETMEEITSTDPTIIETVDQVENIVNDSNYEMSSKKISDSSDSTKNDPNIDSVELNKVLANDQSSQNKSDNHEVIVIDSSDMDDDDEDDNRSEPPVREDDEVPCTSQSKMPENDDSDSDVMIIGSDEEVVPAKRKKMDFGIPLLESDPNYEPVVTLMHRNPETKARIESAVDPLAPDPLEEQVHVNSLEASSKNILESVDNACDIELPAFEKARKEQQLRQEPLQLHHDNQQQYRQESEQQQQQQQQQQSEQQQQQPQSQPQQPQQPQQQQQQTEHQQQKNHNGTERLKGNSVCKNVIDPDIIAQSLIAPEELEKTGASGERLYRCGNITCTYAASTANQLRDHLLLCDLSRDSAGLTCVHCQRPFKQIAPFMEHLKHHGTCRYNCFLCKFRAPLPQQVIKHLKQKHRIYNSIVLPVNQQNTNPEADLFVVCSKDKSRPKLVPHCRNKRIFNPDEVNFLPMKCISYHPLTCNVCNFRSKVVSNMRRHLNFHNNKMSSDEIPICDPVNPVPHLEKKEMMFDKMTNLAASSHPLGRMGGKPPSSVCSGVISEQITLPKFVPEHERYVCGSLGCNYRTCDETMLRYHMRALHCDEISYRCPHCPESMQKDLNGLAISIDRMGAHLKMHDNKLYKCTHCTYFHFQRHIVERHLSDKHPEKRPFVQVVREEGEVPTTSKSDTLCIEGEGNSQSNSGFWMCGLCKAQYATRAEVYEHTAAAHNIKSQYKCNLCTFRSSSKPNCESHFYSRHPGLELDLVTVCQRIEGDSLDSPSVSQSNNALTPSSIAELPSKRFDTTPLWLRNMVRIRHIRGVLLEDEEETRMHLQKLDESLSNKKPKVKELAQTPTSSRAASPELEESDELEQKFAPYGKPVWGNMFFCTICNKYKTRFKQDMKDHLYRELNYVKWMCGHCNLTSCNKHHIQKHSKVHEKEGKLENIVALQIDNDIELWVDRLLTKQHNCMKGIPEGSVKQALPITKGKVNPAPSSSASVGSVSLIKSTNSSPNSKFGSPVKIIDTRDDIGELEDISLISMRHSAQKRKFVDIVKSDLEGYEEKEFKKSSLSSEKSCELGSEIKDNHGDLPRENIVLEGSSPNLPRPPETKVQKKFKCKDCKSVFSVVKGLKLHIRLVHLRLGCYTCGYCDRTGFSVMAIKQHCKSHHVGQPEIVNFNRTASGIKLDDEFWEREYGIKPKSEESSKKIQAVSGQSLLSKTVTSSNSSSAVPEATMVASRVASSSNQMPARFTNSTTPGPSHCASSELPSSDSGSASMEASVSPDSSNLVQDKGTSEEGDEIIVIDEITRKCAHCEYRCKSASDLRSHEMRHWVEKPLKCGHCDFEAVREYEIKKHTAKVHPSKKVRVIQKELPSTPEIKPLQRTRKSMYYTGTSSNKVDISENTDTNNSEHVDTSVEDTTNVPDSTGSKPEEIPTEDRKVYRCFYCPLRATSLGIIHQHWEKVHKERVTAAGVSKNILPFRYKEVNLNELLKGRETTRKRKWTVFTCSYCNKKGTYQALLVHHNAVHPDKCVKIFKVVTQYECAECKLVTLASASLRKHFETQHPNKEFRYMVQTSMLPAEVADTDVPSSGESARPANLALPNDSPVTDTPEKKSITKENLMKYICGWCSETCSSEGKMNFHHTMYHSHLEQKFSVESVSNSSESSKTKMKTFFRCPKCSFKAPSFEEMCEHLRKHSKPFKCGYCGRLFELPPQVRNHNSVMHSSLPPKIISVKDDLSSLKAQVTSVEEEVDASQYPESALTEKTGSPEELDVQPRKKKMLFGYARKSTSMKQRIFSVARKSTNPSPYRYSKQEELLASSESGSSRSNTPSSLEEFSYYGQKVPPLDWKKIRTTVNYGGVNVQVNVETMSQIFNLKPIVLVKDLKTQWKV